MRSALKMLRAKPAPVGLGSWLQMVMDVGSGLVIISLRVWSCRELLGGRLEPDCVGKNWRYGGRRRWAARPMRDGLAWEV